MSHNWKKARVDKQGEGEEDGSSFFEEEEVNNEPVGDDFPQQDFSAISDPQLQPDPDMSNDEGLGAFDPSVHDFDDTCISFSLNHPDMERNVEKDKTVASGSSLESMSAGRLCQNYTLFSESLAVPEQLAPECGSQDCSFEMETSPKLRDNDPHSFEMQDPENEDLDPNEGFNPNDDPELDPEPSLEEPKDNALDSLYSFLDIEDEEVFDEEYFVTDHGTIRGDPPLYSGASLTLHESFVAILTTVIRFQLSGACLKGILDLIYLHLPKADNIFKRSLSFFKTYFLHMQGPKEYRYFCSQCYEELEPKAKCKCEGSKICYLVKISLVHQLQTLFNRNGFYEKLDFSSDSHIQGCYSDIKDGDLYQDLVKSGHLGNEGQISFQFYADGAQVFNSSKVSAWLVYLTLNELPYQDRYKKENVLVPMIWIGPVKPPGNLLTNAAHQDLALLSQGVKFNVKNQGEKIVKALVENHTGDTPARNLMLNIVQHNGECSCQECIQSGEPRAGCPGVRLFPYKPEEMIPRTKNRMTEYASKVKGKIPFLGVKGPSGLQNIMPDFIRGTAIDPMHQLYGGCGKKILKLLISKKKEDQKFSISKHVNSLNSRLLSIKPPLHVPRAPSSLENLAYWKMNEQKAWLLDYSVPVLDGILPFNYLLHHSSLVAASQILNGDIVTKESLLTAQKLLAEYVAQFRDCYDLKFMTINFHLLLHLVEVTRDLGAQWNFSCFPHENINGLILRMVHGTRWTEVQIPASVQMCLGLPDLIENLETSPAKDFCQKLINGNTHPNSIVVRGFMILGKCKAFPEMPDSINQLLNTDTDRSLASKKVSTFMSLRRGKFYYVSSVCNFTSRDSTAVIFTKNLESHVGLIETFVRKYQCDCSNLNCGCDSDLLVVIKELETVRRFKTLLPDVYVPNISEYKVSSSQIVLPVEALGGTCVKMHFDGKLFVSRPSNTKECE